MSSVQISGSFFERVQGIVSNTDQLLEGLFWSSWCGLNVFNWTEARNERETTEKLPSDVEKTDKIWEANKKYTLASFSLVSGFSMVASWLQDVGLIAFGRVAPLFGSVGYGASAVVSGSRLWDGLKELSLLNYSFTKETGPREKSRIGLSQVESLLGIAFNASLVAWGVFGALYALQGGAALFTAMDTSLYYAIILFGANVISSIVIPLLRKTI